MRLPRILLALPAALAGCGPASRPPAPAPRNLILISVDTLRADRLGCYGYERATSPAIDRFAAGGARFSEAFAECSWTIPSHFTMLTGLYPSSHGVQRPDERPSSDVHLLAELLKERGYYTFALTDGGWLSAKQGFARGFDSFFARREHIFDDRRGGFGATLKDAEDFIRFRRDKGPFFGFLHTYDVHCPYDPPEPYLSMFRTPGRQEFDADGKCGASDFNHMDLSAQQAAYLSDRYDGGVRWVDETFAGFLDFLEKEHVLDDTLVVLTSDHGEEFLEHGSIGHEKTLHEEALHIPLILRGPGIGPRVVDTPVGLVDLVPTFLDQLGLDPATGLDGRSLVPLLANFGTPGEPFPAHRLSQLAWQADLDSWIGPGQHLIVDRATGRELFYDLTKDPAELGAGTADDPRRALMRAELEGFEASLRERRRAAEPREGLTPEEVQRLNDLGYAAGH